MGEKNKEQVSMVRDLTSGSVTKQILIFAMPLFVANALQAIYNLVDMVVVGQVIGGTGMSAVSIGGDVLHLLTFLAMGFASAGQVIISQYVGARKHHLISKMIGTMFTFLFAISFSSIFADNGLPSSSITWNNKSSGVLSSLILLSRFESKS